LVKSGDVIKGGQAQQKDVPELGKGGRANLGRKGKRKNSEKKRKRSPGLRVRLGTLQKAETANTTSSRKRQIKRYWGERGGEQKGEN